MICRTLNDHCFHSGPALRVEVQGLLPGALPVSTRDAKRPNKTTWKTGAALANPVKSVHAFAALAKGPQAASSRLQSIRQ